MSAHTETEAQFATWFEDALRLHGWRYYHSRPAVTRGKWATPLSGHPGFPDYVCARDEFVLFVELKSEPGRLTQEQETWVNLLQCASQDADDEWGAHVYVWRPSDRERILEVLG